MDEEPNTEPMWLIILISFITSLVTNLILRGLI